MGISYTPGVNWRDFPNAAALESKANEILEATPFHLNDSNRTELIMQRDMRRYVERSLADKGSLTPALERAFRFLDAAQMREKGGA